jgi:type I restriction enzyme S subunit
MDFISLKDAVSHIVDNRGKTCPTSDSGMPLIATNCVKSSSLYPTKEKIRYVDAETYETWFRGHPEPGDILFVNKGAPGEVCLVPDPVDFCIAQDMVSLRANEKRIDPSYLFAVLRDRGTKIAIENMHVGTMIPHFKKTDFDKLNLPLPSRSDQEFIGQLYLGLSKRIALNQKMNQTLEEIAKAIFKSWFVDFDPVRAKAEGRPTGLPPEISDLFPVELVDSEIGEIPKGWIKTELDEIAEVIDPHPSHRAPKAVSDGYPFAGIGDIDEMGNINLAKARIIAEEAVTEQEQTYQINESSVGIGRVGTVGKVVRLRKQNFRFAISPTLAIVNPRAQDLGVFVYLLLKSQGFQRQVENNMTGSTRPAIGIKVLRSLTTALPEQGVKTMQVFQSLTQSMLLKGDLLNSETQILSELRDTLLPKLISGELRIPDAEKFLEEAGI